MNASSEATTNELGHEFATALFRWLASFGGMNVRPAEKKLLRTLRRLGLSDKAIAVYRECNPEENVLGVGPMLLNAEHVVWISTEQSPQMKTLGFVMFACGGKVNYYFDTKAFAPTGWEAIVSFEFSIGNLRSRKAALKVCKAVAPDLPTFLSVLRAKAEKSIRGYLPR